MTVALCLRLYIYNICSISLYEKITIITFYSVDDIVWCVRQKYVLLRIYHYHHYHCYAWFAWFINNNHSLYHKYSIYIYMTTSIYKQMEYSSVWTWTKDREKNTHTRMAHLALFGLAQSHNLNVILYSHRQTKYLTQHIKIIR